MRNWLTHTFTRIGSIVGDVERNDRRGAFAGIAMLAVLLAFDIGLGEDVNLTGTFVVIPFVAAVWAGVGITAAVAVLALAGGVVSGEWNMNFGSTDYEARLLLLAVGGLLAIASSWGRERGRRGSHRLELLNAVGAVADGSLPLAQTLERVLEVIVPEFADFCMVDAINERRVIRTAVRAGGDPSGADRKVESRLAAREPSLPEWMTRPTAPFPRHPRFIPRMNDEDVRRLAHGQEDLEWLRSLEMSSTISVALLARGRMLGALTFVTAWSDRTYSVQDVRFAQTLAGRVALALDNAGLFSDLESVERRMDNVMSMLDEAVVIHDAQGELVYANPAADRMLGIEAADRPANTTEVDLRNRFQVRSEDGRAVSPSELVGRRALDGVATDPLILRVSDRAGGPERWLITRAKPILGPDGRALYSVTAIEDVTAVKRAEYAQRLLARVGELLASSTDHRRMLRGLVELAVPEFAEWCSLNVPREDGEVEQLAVSHVDPERRDSAIELHRRYPIRVGDEGAISEVLRTGEPMQVSGGEELTSQIPSDQDRERLQRAVGLGSGLIVPMSSGGRTVGALVFANGADGRDFDDDDLLLAAEIARRAGTAVEIARLAEERANVARVLQEGLMPPALPTMDGWETAAVYQPAGEVNAVGGDFYDAFEIEGGWMVTVGDVVGRGAAAASLTALARHTIRTAGLLTADPCAALALLDDALRVRGEQALCTLAVLILPRSDEDPAPVTFVSAGHPLPLRLRDGEVAEVGRPGPLLGAFEGSRWEAQVLELRVGDQLVLFTDGVIEAKGPDSRFGEDRLHANLAGADRPLAAVGRVTGALEAFLGGEPDDDVAVVAVQRSGSRGAVRTTEARDPAAAASGALGPA
jgi:PAS domain S-box-containing protein